MTLVFDLALHATREARSRALDRYARATPPPPGSDEARMLDAMRHARFSIWRVERRHETAGLVVADVLREAEEWLVDEKLEASAPENMAFAGRICEPDDFAMTCGVVVPPSTAASWTMSPTSEASCNAVMAENGQSQAQDGPLQWREDQSRTCRRCQMVHRPRWCIDPDGA